MRNLERDAEIREALTGAHLLSLPVVFRSIELGVTSEDTLLVESDTSCRLQVGRYARPGCDSLVERGDPRTAWFQSSHRPREGIAQAGNELKQR